MQKVSAIFILLFFLSACASDTEGNRNLQTAQLQIEGMVCQMGCAKAIENKLSQTEGVRDVKVSFKEGRAYVAYETATTSPTQIARTVENIGGGGKYKAVILSTSTTLDNTVTETENRKVQDMTPQMSLPHFPTVFEALLGFGKRLR
jgi:copper chaperone CopZ